MQLLFEKGVFNKRELTELVQFKSLGKKSHFNKILKSLLNKELTYRTRIVLLYKRCLLIKDEITEFRYSRSLGKKLYFNKKMNLSNWYNLTP